MPARCCFILWERNAFSKCFEISACKIRADVYFPFSLSFIHSININLATTISGTVIAKISYIVSARKTPK